MTTPLAVKSHQKAELECHLTMTTEEAILKYFINQYFKQPARPRSKSSTSEK
jgi:hypothetical protein